MRPGRILFAAAAAGVLVAAGACASSSSSGGATTPPPEAGSIGSDASRADAAEPSDAASAIDAREPDEVILQVVGAPFAIDTKEISIAEYMLFRQNPPSPVAAIKGCEWKASLGPAPGCDGGTSGDGSRPITCIDWCDAQAYCLSRGKRLCARVGGGAALTTAQRLNPLVDEWSRACGGPMTAERWPYGTTAMPLLCNTAERDAGGTLAAGSLPGCTGAPPELHDMSGNVAEWEDSCPADAGTDAATDTCAVRGGSFQDTADDAKCSRIAELGRAEVSPAVGARCCKDLQQ